MTDELPAFPDDGVLLEASVDEWAWLSLACVALQTLALIVIAVAVVCIAV